MQPSYARCIHYFHRIPPLPCQVALITGGNTGIGFETAKSLLQQDYYVVLGCRSPERAEAARARLRCVGRRRRWVAGCALELTSCKPMAIDGGVCSLHTLVSPDPLQPTPTLPMPQGAGAQRPRHRAGRAGPGRPVHGAAVGPARPGLWPAARPARQQCRRDGELGAAAAATAAGARLLPNACGSGGSLSCCRGLPMLPPPPSPAGVPPHDHQGRL